MARNKQEGKKIELIKANKVAKRAPVWVFAKTNRGVRDSPKSRRSWRHDSIY
jgi:large subunit ribosomal protein L39e